MSIDQSKEKTSPNLDIPHQSSTPLVSGNYHEKRLKRSYSVVTSLDRLTNKLKSGQLNDLDNKNLKDKNDPTKHASDLYMKHDENLYPS
jgi:hypothetical protein